jgi:hypothetical protein
MRGYKILFFASMSLLLSLAADAQVKKSVRSSSFRVPSVSKSKARIVCPIFQNSQYPYQGLGIKLGDPFAATYKYYPNKHWAFALDAGKAASGLYNRYYRNSFSSYLPDTLSGEQAIRYLSHRALTDWLVEAKFLYQWDAEKISKGLQFYVGLGWQWRSTNLEYDYFFDDGPFGDNRLAKFRESRFSYGATGVLGFEYSYFSLPLSAFIEIEWFMDALLDPGYQRFQGGVGLRYVF